MYHLICSCRHLCFRFAEKLRLKYVCAYISIFMILDYFGAFTHLFEISYDTHFTYPYEGDVHEFVMALKHHEKPTMDPINQYNYTIMLDNKQKCIEQGYSTFRIVYVVKSAIENFERRKAIRSSWGFERRFFDVPSRTVFLLGMHPDDELQAKVNIEATKHKDIIQANFIDAYYNNTIKTMTGLKWLVKHCLNAKFYMFVDDDMYVSVKNVLRFIRNPANYPDYLKEPKKFGAHKREVIQSDVNALFLNITQQTSYSVNSHNKITSEIINSIKERRRNEFTSKWNDSTLSIKNQSVVVESTGSNSQQDTAYSINATVLQRNKRQIFDFELPEDVRLFAGFVFVSSPHRHKSSKWYVSLKEYPYHLWPPYVSAGAYILSKEALIDMYYTSLYTKHFRFDDIFLGIVAKKAHIEPFHCEEFHFYKKDYTKFNYKYVITSHGYDDPNELLYVWNEQKALGNA